MIKIWKLQSVPQILWVGDQLFCVIRVRLWIIIDMITKEVQNTEVLTVGSVWFTSFILHTVTLTLHYKNRKREHNDGLVQDCSNSIALAMELLQSCTTPSLYKTLQLHHVLPTLQRQCRYFDRRFGIVGTKFGHVVNFRCSQWRKLNQNDRIFISVYVINFIIKKHTAGSGTEPARFVHHRISRFGRRSVIFRNKGSGFIWIEYVYSFTCIAIYLWYRKYLISMVINEMAFISILLQMSCNHINLK